MLEGTSYLLTMMAAFLVVAAGLGVFIGTLIVRRSSGAQEDGGELERMRGHYQASERARRELEEKLSNWQKSFESNTVPDSAETHDLRAQVAQFADREASWTQEKQRLESRVAEFASGIGGSSPAEAGELTALRSKVDVLTQDRENLEKERTMLRNELERAQSSSGDAGVSVVRQQLDDLQRRYDLLDQQHERLQFEAAAAAPMRNELQSVRDQFAKAEQRAITLEKELEQVREVQFDDATVRTEAERDHLAAELARARSRNEELVAEIGRLETAASAAPAAFAGGERDAGLRTQLDDMTEERDRLAAEVELAGLRNAAMQEQKVRLAELEQRLAEAPSHEDAIAALQTEVDSARNEAEFVRGQVAAFEAEKSSLLAKVDQAQSMALEQGTIIANLETSLADAERKAGAIEAFENKVSQLEASLLAAQRRAEAAEELERKTADLLAQLETSRQAEQALQQKLGAVQSDLESTHQALALTSRRADDAEARVKEAESNVRDAESRAQAFVAVEPTPIVEAPQYVPVEVPPPLPTWATEATIAEPPIIVDEHEPVAQPEQVLVVVEPEPLPEPIPEPPKERRSPRRMPTTPDDLEEIIGVGPIASKALKELEFDSYRKIAGMTAADIDLASKSIADLRARISAEKWREQARVLHRLKYGREP